MRFISLHCIQPKAILAKPILGPAGQILLNAGVAMEPNYLHRLAELGIPGAYVHDPLSEGVEVINAISDELRMHAIKNISNTYSKAEEGKAQSQASGYEMRNIAENIVEEVINHGDTMLNLFDMKVYDSYTFFHCVNVTVLSVIIGLGMNFPKNKLINLAHAALLHDLGKVFIPPEIINKPGKLTDDEFEIVKRHPQEGYDYIKEMFANSITESIAVGVLDHHERVNGSGYPSGKNEREICDIGRAIAIADVYDAFISDRPYRKGTYSVAAMEYIMGGGGTYFDYSMVQVFSRKVALFPVGTCVLLSNNTSALVLENYEGFTHRPRIKVFRKDSEDIDPYEINLKEEARDITIITSVDI